MMNNQNYFLSPQYLQGSATNASYEPGKFSIEQVNAIQNIVDIRIMNMETRFMDLVIAELDFRESQKPLPTNQDTIEGLKISVREFSLFK